MKIAVTSVNGKTICGYAGHCRDFLIYEIHKDQSIRRTQLQLEPTQILSELKLAISQMPEHPLQGIHVFITQGLPDNLAQRLVQDKIKVIQTNDLDPILAINRLELTRH